MGEPLGAIPPGSAQAPAPLDAVEQALADAIGKAAAAGAFEAVTALAAELKARREARAAVVSLDAVRRRREV